MARIRRSTYHWIAIVYLALLTAQATGFSACQQKPQEIHIAKGKKVTVVYWVGQNALDSGAIEGKLSTDIPSTTSIPEETSTYAEVTTEGSLEETTSQVPDESSVSPRHGDVATESNLQSSASTEQATPVATGQPSSEVPSTALPGTHPTPVLNSNALGEDAITPETPEGIDVSGRNGTAEESTTPASETDIITSAVDLETASTQAEEGTTTVLGQRSGPEGSTSEVEYWSTTPVSEGQEEEDTTVADSAEVTTGGPRSSKLDETTEIAGNATSEEAAVTEGQSETEQTLQDIDLKSSRLDGTPELSTEAAVSASSEDPRQGKLDESSSALPVEATTEATTEDNETNLTSTTADLNELRPKSLDGHILNETTVEVNVENSTNAISNASEEVIIAGRQPEAESATGTAEDNRETTSGIELVTETGTEAESENRTQTVEGRLVEEPANDTESSSPVNLDVRAAVDAETLSPITDGTESAEIVSEESSQPSVLEVISTTFKNLFSTLAPSTDASADENASPTEQTLDGWEQDANVTAAIENLESTEGNLSNETLVPLEGRGQEDNATTGNAEIVQEPFNQTLEGRENDSNSTLETFELEGSSNANETLEGRDHDVSSTDNEVSTSSPDIVFRNTTAENGVTIEPRNADNGTAEELVPTKEAEDSTENLDQRSDATSEATAIPTEPPIATGLTEDITEEVFNSQRVVTDAGPAVEYDESELQDGELDEPDNRPLDGFDAPPSDIFVPIGQSGVDGVPENDGSTEEARKMESYPMENFESFMAHTAPDLLRIPVDDSQYEKETRKREFLKPSSGKDNKPIHFLRPSVYNSRNPFPPPYLMQFPARRSDNAPHPFSGYMVPEGANPPVFAGDLQPQPSSSGPFYPSYYEMSSIVLPPESPVHYVSVMRPPDGVLPIRSLRMSPAQRSFHQTRSKREILANATNCQWNFKSDPGVPLLLTFKSFSTPETQDCEEHYIAVERESNGFQSRWCGVSGERPGHASFARSEINLNLYSNGDGSFPTGFSVEVQALDLKLLRKYAEVRRIIKHQ